MNRTSHPALALVLALVPAVGLGAGAYVEASFVDADLDYAGASSNGVGLRGGYRFNRHVALEAAYIDMQGARGSLCNMDACIPEGPGYRLTGMHRADLTAVGSVALGARAHLYAKAGLARMSGTLTIHDMVFSTTTVHRATDTGALFGAGGDEHVPPMVHDPALGPA